MKALSAFAALSMSCAALLSVLDGSRLRKTAALAMGLVLAWIWVQGLAEQWPVWQEGGGVSLLIPVGEEVEHGALQNVAAP